ncbi:ImmA/IrrE family metallo-endopeptidase [Niallia taxi]|uniref:ImmA/IrrE family metallo-endopeptidase n=1 Tax=Niallia taxi TaxID=2499688 RepID=UPI0021A81A21|nr:ImmA/IrrE family metallo-endopeptidase [Niallia taxi]MCT2342649.1 ImmA/IrrE family metallo-endopeptidase [Niallia taxi]
MSENPVLSKQRKEQLHNEIIPIAHEFRKKYLDDGPIIDTFKTLEELGYFVVRFPTKSELSGFHIKKGEYDCIFVNSSHSLGRQYFSAWHECYHAYTGDGGGISLFNEIKLNETEYKAECFASCILMPDDLVKNYARKSLPKNMKYISYQDLIKMQAFFKVSYSALITRLRVIFPQFDATFKSRYTLGTQQNAQKLIDKTKEYNGDLSLISRTNKLVIPESFYQTVYNNLQNDRISSDKVQRLLEMLESVKKKYEL